MNLVTTCPDCGTAFKVKPEQLTARRGDVCCGKCGFIFNALDHLAETPALEEPQQISAAAFVDELPQNAGEESISEEADAKPVAIHEINVEIDIVPDAEIALVESPQDAEATQSTNAATELETAVHLEPNASIPEVAIESAEQPAEPATTLEPKPSAEALPESEPTIKFELLDLEPKRRFSSLLPSILAVLLLFSGLGQVAYFMRTQLAAQYLPAKPFLVQLCGILSCTVELPHQADLLAIDESDLQQDAEHENVVILSSTLINHALYAQAYPALEVSLTDANDHPLLRRIFRPDEYLPTNTDLKAGMPPAADIRIKLHLNLGDVKATGYRVYVSYL